MRYVVETFDPGSARTQAECCRRASDWMTRRCAEMGWEVVSVQVSTGMLLPPWVVTFRSP